MGLNLTVDLIGHLELSGMCLGVDLRSDTKIYMCLGEIELYAQNMLIFPGSIVNIDWGDLCDHLMRIFTLIMNKIFM